MHQFGSCYIYAQNIRCSGWMDGWMGGWMDGKAGCNLAVTTFTHKILQCSGWMDGWMVGWVDGWMGGWVDGKAGLRIAYSNKKCNF